MNHPTALVIRHTSAVVLHAERQLLAIAADALVREIFLRAYVARLEEAVRRSYGFLSMAVTRAFDDSPVGSHEAALMHQRLVAAHQSTGDIMRDLLAVPADA